MTGTMDIVILSCLPSQTSHQKGFVAKQAQPEKCYILTSQTLKESWSIVMKYTRVPAPDAALGPEFNFLFRSQQGKGSCLSSSHNMLAGPVSSEPVQMALLEKIKAGALNLEM